MVDDGELHASINVYGGSFDSTLLWAIGNSIGVSLQYHLLLPELTDTRADGPGHRRGAPSWTNALGLTALGFISASLGLQVRRFSSMAEQS